MRPGISVVICVYTEDRWGDILAAVHSVAGQSYAAHETLLVVDHNPELLRRLTACYGHDEEVRVLANAGPRGLSAGRNTGVAASTGEVVAFLDDDAVAERDWLRFFTEGYAEPEVMAVGGRTLPVWASGRRPAWFPEEFDWAVGCTYRGLPPGRVRVRNVLGGNASFRREAFELTGGFATGIGRDGDKRPLGGEETELCIRLSRARPDAVLLIDDRAVIHHKVPAARERFGYLRDRSYAEGLSKALVARSVGADAGLESERRYTTRVLPAGIARGVRDALLGRPGGAGRAAAIVVGATAAATGYAVGMARTRAGDRPVLAAPVPDAGAAGEVADGAVSAPARGTDGRTAGPAADTAVSAPARGANRGTTADSAVSAPAPVGSANGAAPVPGVPADHRAPARTARRAGSGGGRRRAGADEPAPVPILMYHAVGQTPSAAAYDFSVSPDTFAAQLQLLDDGGYSPVTTRELGDAWRSGRALPPRPVLITFDDGYEGVHRHALPVIEKHGFTATLFASTGWLRGPDEIPGAPDTMLAWEQLLELAAAGLEIGGHSHTHPQLDQLSDGRLREELLRCRELLTERTGSRPVSFAYPYGYSSRRVRQAVRAAGFAQSLAVGNALASRSQSPYALTRITVRRGTPLERFERMLEGRAPIRDFAGDRALTKGYAAVRGARRALRLCRPGERGGG